MRFSTRKAIRDIFQRRKALKGTGSNIYINVDLTKLNTQRLMELKHHPGVLRAWSFQGKLYAKLIDLQTTCVEDGDADRIDRLLLHSINK